MTDVYLDTNIWINLEKAWYGDGLSGSDKDVVNSLIASVQNRTIRLPLSYFHCIEMVKRKDRESRDRLWRFAVSLSQCTGLKVRHSIEPYLVKKAVSRVFHVPDDGGQFDPYTNSGLFGLPLPDEFPLTDQCLRTPDGWIGFWLEMPEDIREQMFPGLRKLERSFIERRNSLKSSSRNEDCGTRKRAYVASLFMDHQELYLDAMGRIGRSPKDIEGLDIEERMSLIMEVPPFDVEVALATQHQQQWDRQEEENDIRDISHLCMAVPYCDVVVTERYWVDKLRREKMGEKYKTRLLSDISGLARVLSQ